MDRPAIVLLSGGLDSTTVLAIAKDQGFTPYALSFRYGQRHSIELEAAQRVAQTQGVARHVIADIDLRVFGGSALTSDIEVPKHETLEDVEEGGVPITYVAGPQHDLPLVRTGVRRDGRCQRHLHRGHSRGLQRLPRLPPRVHGGLRHHGQPGHPSRGGRNLQDHPAFPLIALSKADIVREGLRLGVDYSLTSSCYDPDEQGRACGKCDTCLLRLKGFAEAGVKDPVRYQSA